MARNAAVGPAILLTLVASMLFASMDAISKYLTCLLPVACILWARFTLQALLMGGTVVASLGPQGFRSKYFCLQISRGVLLISASTTAVHALQTMPLAEFTAIVMLTPVVVTTVAGVALKERASMVNWLFVFGGFIGTLIVIRPGSGLFGSAALLPLLCMVLLAGYQLLSGRLAHVDAPTTTQFYTGITGSLLLLPIVLFQFEQTNTQIGQLHGVDGGLLCLIGVLGSVGHLLLVMAFKWAGTSTMMPFTYSQVGFAALVGWFAFGHRPDAWSTVGITVITVCGAGSAFVNLRCNSSPKGVQ